MRASTVFGAVAAAGVALATVAAVERRFGPAGTDVERLLRDGARAFSRDVLNPAMLQLTRFDGMRTAVITHVGRRSGRIYRTPVAAVEVAQGVLVPLAFGLETDWSRNVLAAGGCTMRMRGREFALGHPELIGPDRALPMVDAFHAAIWRTVGARHFLLLRQEAPHGSIAA